MVNPSYMVSCTFSVPASAPDQAVFCDHLKSNIEEYCPVSQNTPMKPRMITQSKGLCILTTISALSNWDRVYFHK